MQKVGAQLSFCSSFSPRSSNISAVAHVSSGQLVGDRYGSNGNSALAYILCLLFWAIVSLDVAFSNRQHTNPN